MKTNFNSVALSLVALAGILASPLSAAPDKSPAVMYQVSDVWRDGAAIIKPGTAESTVRYFLGSPTYEPSENVRIYHRFSADLDEVNARDCHNLVLTFAKGRVKSVLLVNDKAVRVITAQAKASPAEIPALMYASTR